jgi:hypothetical protein
MPYTRRDSCHVGDMTHAISVMTQALLAENLACLGFRCFETSVCFKTSVHPPKTYRTET